ncbi:hypothetical protein JKP88DRAFT_202432 [Tribonema minus]|uniref:Cyclin N-terminal domain-containing protein n=1 Tax=Tribonema minus TaxID=303371 RepID=A0A836CAK0_9STRA|nr:hypothetical protein JKP88DRAFT_202432 [Tribonema minus]
MLKMDACAMIRHIGRAMRYGERAMLSAFHFFHHFHWVSLDAGQMWPATDLPAVCLACLHLAGKAEDTAFRIDYLMDIADQMKMALPPYGAGTGRGGGSSADILAAGRAPSRADVVRYEYRILETRRFNTNVQHPSRRLPEALARARVPAALRDVVPGVFQTRAYTDCDLCLQEDYRAVIAAAIVYMALVQRRGGGGGGGARAWALPENFFEQLGVPWAKVADFVALMVQTVKDVRLREPVQTLLKIPVRVVHRKSASARKRSESTT